jgi:hypothetical protein
MRQQGDILPVERRHKGAVQHGDNLVGDGVTAVLHLGNFGYPAIDKLPGVDHFLEQLGRSCDIFSAFLEEVKKFLLTGHKIKPDHICISFKRENRASSGVDLEIIKAVKNDFEIWPLMVDTECIPERDNKERN